MLCTGKIPHRTVALQDALRDVLIDKKHDHIVARDVDLRSRVTISELMTIARGPWVALEFAVVSDIRVKQRKRRRESLHELHVAVSQRFPRARGPRRRAALDCR